MGGRRPGRLADLSSGRIAGEADGRHRPLLRGVRGAPARAKQNRRRPTPRGSSSPRTLLRAPMISWAYLLFCATFSRLRRIAKDCLPGGLKVARAWPSGQPRRGRARRRFRLGPQEVHRRTQAQGIASRAKQAISPVDRKSLKSLRSKTDRSHLFVCFQSVGSHAFPFASLAAPQGRQEPWGREGRRSRTKGLNSQGQK